MQKHISYLTIFYLIAIIYCNTSTNNNKASLKINNTNIKSNNKLKPKLIHLAKNKNNLILKNAIIKETNKTFIDNNKGFNINLDEIIEEKKSDFINKKNLYNKLTLIEKLNDFKELIMSISYNELSNNVYSSFISGLKSQAFFVTTIASLTFNKWAVNIPSLIAYFIVCVTSIIVNVELNKYIPGFIVDMSSGFLFIIVGSKLINEGLNFTSLNSNNIDLKYIKEKLKKSNNNINDIYNNNNNNNNYYTNLNIECKKSNGQYSDLNNNFYKETNLSSKELEHTNELNGNKLYLTAKEFIDDMDNSSLFNKNINNNEDEEVISSSNSILSIETNLLINNNKIIINGCYNNNNNNSINNWNKIFYQITVVYIIVLLGELGNNPQVSNILFYDYVDIRVIVLATFIANVLLNILSIFISFSIGFIISKGNLQFTCGLIFLFYGLIFFMFSTQNLSK